MGDLDVFEEAPDLGRTLDGFLDSIEMPEIFLGASKEHYEVYMYV